MELLRERSAATSNVRAAVPWSRVRRLFAVRVDTGSASADLAETLALQAETDGNAMDSVDQVCRPAAV